jgi:hypothetical protein
MLEQPHGVHEAIAMLHVTAKQAQQRAAELPASDAVLRYYAEVSEAFDRLTQRATPAEKIAIVSAVAQEAARALSK